MPERADERECIMTTVTVDPVIVEKTAEESEATSRHRRLAEGVRSLRTRAGEADTARLLLIIGGVLVPLGIVLILLAWLGAARTPRVFEQIPYMISGGLLGLALVFAGSFCYFTFWLTQLVLAARRDAADTRDALGRIETLLATSLAEQAEARAVGDAAEPAAASALDGTRRRTRPLVAGSAATFLATESGTMYHRPTCPTVAGREGVRQVSADNGLVPCKICEPDAELQR